MNFLKPAALTAALLLGSWFGSNAWAAATPAQPTEVTETTKTAEAAEADTKAEAKADANAEAYAKLPVCKLSEDGKRLIAEPCRTAPAAVPMPRRPVPLTIQRMPSTKVAPQVAMPQMAPSTPIETLMQPPGSPVPAVGCTAAGCYDPSGARHSTGPAGTTVTPTGKLCSRQGVWIQC
ncbi:MAG TPA: hypothetical protein VF670_09840 [Duganella sp.]|jgi:hypothetical protein